MATYQFNTANTEGVNFGLTYTAYDQTAAISATNSPDNPGPPFQLGQTVKGSGDSDFVFVKASAAIGAGDTCLISTAFNAAGITTTTATSAFGQLVGVAVVAIASGSYGWIQRAGRVTPSGMRVLDAAAPFAQLSTTATAGTLDDATTTALVRITGLIITATNNAGSSAVVAGMLNYPVVGAAY
jgi:hypothetical protein